MASDLQGKVAVVAGATRGAGRGIAVALGERGCTVVCAGRSVRGAPSPMARPETLEETAGRVDAAGGEGIVARADLADDAQVKELFARVARERGRLDVLVNDVWGGDPLVEWGKPFWELDMPRALQVVGNVLRTHLLAARHAAPLMVRAKRGLIVEVTDGDTMQYRGNLAYDLAKVLPIRMAWGFAEELRPHGVAAVALTPGFLRSEAMLDHFGVREENWRDGAKKDPNFLHSESPLFVGRAVAALAADPHVLRRSGRAWSSWGLAKEYGFIDADGSRPDWGAHFARAYGAEHTPALDDDYYRYLGDAERFRAALERGPRAQPGDKRPGGSLDSGQVT